MRHIAGPSQTRVTTLGAAYFDFVHTHNSHKHTHTQYDTHTHTHTHTHSYIGADAIRQILHRVIVQAHELFHILIDCKEQRPGAGAGNQ